MCARNWDGIGRRIKDWKCQSNIMCTILKDTLQGHRTTPLYSEMRRCTGAWLARWWAHKMGGDCVLPFHPCECLIDWGLASQSNYGYIATLQGRTVDHFAHLSVNKARERVQASWWTFMIKRKKPETGSQRDNTRTGPQTQLKYLLHYRCSHIYSATSRARKGQ